MSNLTKRDGFLATDETTKAGGIVLPISFSIEIERALPIVAYDTNMMTERVILSTPNVVKTPLLTKYTLTALYDNNGVEEERYDFIGYANSPITGNSIRFYYDNKFKDVIVIPNTEFLVMDENLMSGRHMKLNGYILGSTNTTESGVYSELVSVVDTGSHATLPKFNNNIAITTEMYKLPGISQSTSVHDSMLGLMLTPDVYLERQGSDKTIMLNLGLFSDALVDSTVGLPMFMLYAYNTKYHTAKYLGNRVPPVTTTLGVVLDF